MSKTHPLICRSRAVMRLLIAPLTAMLGMMLLLSSVSAQGAPTLDIENKVAISPNSSVTVPINFAANGSSINALAFSVDFDELGLMFDPTDNNGDGIPDAISFNLPAGFGPVVTFDADDTDGEIDIAIFNLNPIALTDGTIASITFTTGNVSSATDAAINFSLDPVVSFGGTDGSDVAGILDNGSVQIDLDDPPSAPQLAIANDVPALLNSQVTIPINFAANGNNINSLVIPVDFDESRLTFDPVDGNGDGIPDAISFNLPIGFSPSVSFDASDTDGEIDIGIFATLSDVTLPDSTIVSITFNTGATDGTAAVNFSQDPVASFGDANGVDVSGTTNNGSANIIDGENTIVVSKNNDEKIYPLDEFSVDATVQGTGIFGTQVQCVGNTNFFVPLRANFGPFFTDHPILIGQDEVDAGAGTWIGALALRRPATPLSGSGLFASLVYQAVNSGTADITCTPLFSDENGVALPGSHIPDSITISAFGDLNGTVTYQGRNDHTDIEVKISGPISPTNTSTNNTGQFNFTSLIRDGNYQIEASAALYLPSCFVDERLDSNNPPSLQTQLRGGDTNNDGKINIGDATLLAANFNTAVPPGNINGDINADLIINIQDLSILGSNYGLDGCQPWQ